MVATGPWRRTFVIFWCGQFVSLTGLAFAMYSVGVYSYRLSASTADLGLAFALTILPFIVASPVAGPLVDRWGARRSLVVANLAGVANLLLLLGLHLTDTLPGMRVSVFLWLAAAIKSMHLAAFEAAVPFLVPKDHLGRANGLRMVLTGAGAVLGPVVAEPALAVAGVPGVIGMCGLTFAVAVASLRLVPVPVARHVRYGDSVRVPRPGGFREVWRYVTARPGLVALLACVVAVNCGIGAAELLFSQLTLSFTSYASLDLVLLAGALGLVTATVVMLWWGGPRRRTTGVFGFSLVMAGAMVLGAVRPNVLLLAVAAFLFLGATPVVMGCVQTLFHVKVEPELLGRAAALKNLFVDVPYAVTQLLTGFVTGLLVVPLVGRDDVRSPVVTALVGDGPGRGFALLMMVMGVLIAVCVVLAFRYPRLRGLERELPDVTPADLAATAEPAVRAAGGADAETTGPHPTATAQARASHQSSTVVPK